MHVKINMETGHIVKLRQGSGKGRQGVVNKRPLKATERPESLNPCLELKLKLVATFNLNTPAADSTSRADRKYF